MTAQEQQELDEDWEDCLDWLEEQFGNRPNLETVLFLIGIQELGQLRKEFSKEEKQDLMHIAVCRLLSEDGYFEYKGKDEEGWPHYEGIKSMPVDTKGLVKEEVLLKQKILDYFDFYNED